MIKDAEISPCGLYRYMLRRIWDEDENFLVFCLLNPSTADEKDDDPTIRKCIGFAKKNGFGGIIIINLFGIRSPNPKNIKIHSDPFGPDLSRNWIRATHQSYHFVFGWGNMGLFKNAQMNMHKFFFFGQSPLYKIYCLGKNKNGTPKHPLYVPYTKEFEPYFTK